MKKIIILLIVLVSVIAVISYLYFYKLDTETENNDIALQIATYEASAVFSFQNDKSFYQIIESQDLLQQVLGSEKVAMLRSFKKTIIDIDKFNAYFSDQPIYLSILPDGAEDFNFLFTAQILPSKNINQLKSSLIEKPQIVKKIDEIYNVKFSDSLEVFLGFKNNVVTASSSLKAVQNAGKSVPDKQFIAYVKQNNQKNILATLYINFNHLPRAMESIVNGKMKGDVAFLNEQNSYAYLNYNFSKEKILFNGNTDINNEDNYLTLFENIAPQNIYITSILPHNTASYVDYAYDDYGKWGKKLDGWFKEKNEEKSNKNKIKQIQNQYRVNLATVFPLYTKNQFITFQLSTAEKLAAISLSNGEKVKQLLLDISDDYNAEIKVFKPEGVLYPFFGEPFKKFKRPFYTIIDNNLVVANNASTIQSFLINYRNNRLLSQSPAYLDAMNHVSSTSNVSVYVNLKNADGVFRNTLNLPFYTHLKKEILMNSFDTFYYQMSTDGNKFITNVLLNKYLKPQIPDTLSTR